MNYYNDLNKVREELIKAQCKIMLMGAEINELKRELAKQSNTDETVK